VYGLRVGLDNNYGQGREFGTAQWIHLTNSGGSLEDLGSAAGLTGSYRPEDADLDPIAMSHGQVRVCSTNTGDETNHLYGQTICITDGSVQAAEANTATPEVEPFQIGGTSQGINMPDNVAFQPQTGNLVLHEDAETDFEGPHNNDLWDCLPDGPDQDLLTDGCIRVPTLNDLTAEWTGGTFDATGKHFYVSIQPQHQRKGHDPRHHRLEVSIVIERSAPARSTSECFGGHGIDFASAVFEAAVTCACDAKVPSVRNEVETLDTDWLAAANGLASKG
jgi:secreted PhoX family phosphatase